MQIPVFYFPHRASTGAAWAGSCTCIKSYLLSGQAWRGEHCAPKGLKGIVLGGNIKIK